MKAIQEYGESGEKIQDETTTTKHLVTGNMVVDTTLHPGL